MQVLPIKEPSRDAMILEDGSELLLIHYAYRDDVLRIWRIACAPDLREFSASITRIQPYKRSDDTRAVTCPSCQNTPRFKAAKEVTPLLR